MSGWPTVPLGELASITKGVSYTSAGLKDSGRVMVNLKNIGKGGGFRPEGNKFYSGEVKSAHLLEGGDLLLAYTDLTKAKEILGCPVIVPDSAEYVGACYSMDLGKIDPDPARLDREYLAYFLQSSGARDYMKANGSGATVMHLRTAAVPALMIPLPPLDEQKRIVAKLDAISQSVSERRKAQATLLRLLDLSWFQVLDHVFRPRVSPWPIKTIADVCTLRSGTTVSRALEQDQGALPYLKVADMNLPENSSRIVTSSRFLSASSVKSPQILPVGTTIIPKRGGAIATNKKRMTEVPICADLNIMGIIPGAQIDPEFLFFFFQSIDLATLGTGSSIPQINNYDIAPIEISLPETLEEQREVVRRLLDIQRSLDLFRRNHEVRAALLVDLLEQSQTQVLAGAACP